VVLGRRSALALGLVSLVGLAAFAWPLLLRVDPGGAGHVGDAPLVFVVVLPLLVAVVLFANMPDTVFNEKRDYKIGYLIDETGEVVNGLDPEHPAKGRGKSHGHTPKAGGEAPGH